MGKILENNVPVFVITFATQEMLLFRNAKTREVMIGSESNIEQCHYAAVITRVEEELDNELTGGWKVMEVCSGMLLQGYKHLMCFCESRWAEDPLVHTSRSPLFLSSHFTAQKLDTIRRSLTTLHSLHTPPYLSLT